jgi:uncharacterized protein YkwD
MPLTIWPTGNIKSASPWSGKPYGVPWSRISQWQSLINKWSEARGLDPIIVAAIVVIESQGNAAAWRGADGYDGWPAVGLMQAKPHYWWQLVPGHDENDVYWQTAEGAIDLGTAVLAYAIGKHGSWQAGLVKEYFPGNDAATRTTQASYIATVESLYREIQAAQGGNLVPVSSGVNIGNRPLRVALGTGHANTSGGNAFELAVNAECTNYLYRVLSADRRFDVRCYTPNEGLGMFPGPLDEAAAEVRHWAAAGWVADILHEVHHEGTGTPSIRGGFFIYPDSAGLSGRNAGDIDTDVQSEAGRMASLLAAAIGTTTRYNPPQGMSERQTGVGAQGFRLGVFGAWADRVFIDNSFRFISEAATYTNAQDLAIIKQANYAELHAKGIIDAYIHLATTRGAWTLAGKQGGAIIVPPTRTRSEARPEPIPGVVQPQLIKGKVYYPAGKSWPLVAETPLRQYANPESVILKMAKAGSVLEFDYAVVGDDEQLWLITKEGYRILAAATARGVSTTPEPVPSGTNISELEREMLTLVNKYRRKRGRSELTWDDKLLAASQWFADDMARTKSFSYEHIDSLGRRWRPRFDSFGFTHRTAGENIGWGYTAEQMLQEFINSPPHNENLLNAVFTRIGIGYQEGSGSTGVRKVWVLDFGGNE